MNPKINILENEVYQVLTMVWIPHLTVISPLLTSILVTHSLGVTEFASI
jgi:hypothetical protein